MTCRRSAAIATVDIRSLNEFVLAELPAAPARVLEVGCGNGELARAVDAAGYEVLAIDPAAPEGEIFRRIKLEELEERERFDAVVAARSLHHIHDLDAGLDRIAAVLRPGGVLVVDDFGWDRLAGATAEWFHGQRRALAAAGRHPAAPATVDECCREWEDEHAGFHGYGAMRAALDARFRERLFAWTTLLHRYLDGVAAEALEHTLIEADAIEAIAFRYVGERR